MPQDCPPPKRSKLRRWLKLVLLPTIGLWILNVFLMKLFESRFVFRPTTAAESWREPPAGTVRDVTFSSTDGETIHGWWMPHAESRGAILFFHGNGGNLSHRGPLVVELNAKLGRSVLIIDYPGYGKSTGEPSETGCYASADAAMDWLNTTQKIPAEHVCILGESLGGGVATDLAARRGCCTLVLLKTFTSAPDVGRDLFPWLPTNLLMSNRFDNATKIGKVKQPVFVAHGNADRTVPFQLGENLFQLANEPKRFLAMDGISHNDPLPPSFFAELRKFLDLHAM